MTILAGAPGQMHKIKHVTVAATVLTSFRKLTHYQLGMTVERLKGRWRRSGVQTRGMKKRLQNPTAVMSVLATRTDPQPVAQTNPWKTTLSWKCLSIDLVLGPGLGVVAVREVSRAVLENKALPRSMAVGFAVRLVICSLLQIFFDGQTLLFFVWG
jgi:hypothetical protein